MADSDAVEVARLAERKPRGLGGNDLGRYETGQVASDRVECQCRCCICQRLEFTVRNESQLDQSLEAVADAKSQSVTGVEELLHGFLELFVAEYGQQ